MGKTEHQIPFELDESGHLCDEAVVACADGQLEIVSAVALKHLDTCDACNEEVATAAELSLNFDLSLAPELDRIDTVMAPVRRRVPKAALAGALALAVLGVLPSVMSAGSFDPRPLLQALSVTLRSLPQLLGSIRAEDSALGAIAPLLLALLLMGVGTAIALRQTFATRNQNA